MSNKNRKMAFIRIMNFTEDANKAVNKAIYFANQEKCAKVNVVHLFLALVEHTEFGNSIMEHLKTTFDMLYSSYQSLAASGEYGRRSNNSNELEDIPEDFERELFELIASTSWFTTISMKEVTAETLFHNLIVSDYEKLLNFFDYIGLNVDDLEHLQYETFIIPEDLQDFVIDLNATLAENDMKISGVDNYIDEMIEVLSRKLKSNPCLVGESGVGKTTIVHGLVKRIINGNVPEQFINTHVVSINSALFTAGTRYRGDFEERMKSLIDWASYTNVIIFFDELHTFINLGKNSENSADTAGNMLKPYLADGSIRIIGTTTLPEYHKYIEKDLAFSRRIQDIKIKQPSIDAAIQIINDVKSEYEDYHSISIPDDTIELAVKLSDRYIKNKMLPDKAFTILDQASAKVKLLNRKAVTQDDILGVISNLTNIDINRLSTKETKQLMSLEETLSKNLIGQKDAISTVCKAIRRAKAGVREYNKPLASFLFVGPTGVGKTELCRVLSKEVAIGDAPLIKIDMSEYSEKHSISKMIGSAPGYVGYGEGGQLTEKVKHNPYSILLFDEIEKAHPEVFNIFLQMLDDGCLTDAEGNKVDFTNCIIVMTSNAGYGADGLNKGSLGFASASSNNTAREKEKIAMKALEETFKPEFINRLDNIVIFEKLTKEQCVEITKLLLNKLSDRMLEQCIKLKFNKSIIDRIVEIGYSDKYGARNIRREIQDTVEDVIADAVIDGTLYEGCIASVSWKNNTVNINIR